ncbi:putative metal ion transport protein [Nostocoides japonicum T1-X7]|uniref:Putative metal ion transport protein n=1 Tax=Nostocoides japonicum T1-X7 TaxID=1194083 RepID=A0A077M6B3_9MICO|nr:magnesium transporter CorA family protein [Tetrasphaera japonica]CCH79590.1 putative metal ion transport protein [Tetrasphaera japonica T1-X7]
MTTTCIVSGRAWRDGHPVAGELTEDDLHRLHRETDALVWVDVRDPSPADLRRLLHRVGLPDGAIEDVTAPYERPKVARYGDHVFFQAYATWMADHPAAGEYVRLRTGRVSGFVGPGLLVTIREGDAFDMAPVVRGWEENADLIVEGAAALLYGLLDVVVDSHFDTVQRLDDDLEDLEDVLFAERRTGHDFARRTYGIRKDLVRLRRVVLPMRDVVDGLMRHRSRPEGNRFTALDAWFDDLYDHVLRAAEWTESLRDMVSTIFETNLSLQDARLNTVMKKLAGWGAIIAVPTAVTGWFGQNIPFPGFGRHGGLAVSVALIVVATAALYALFRSRDWL